MTAASPHTLDGFDMTRLFFFSFTSLSAFVTGQVSIITLILFPFFLFFVPLPFTSTCSLLYLAFSIRRVRWSACCTDGTLVTFRLTTLFSA